MGNLPFFFRYMLITHRVEFALVFHGVVPVCACAHMCDLKIISLFYRLYARVKFSAKRN